MHLYRVKVEESKIAFDYRVRSLTHNFIIDLIKNCSKIEDLLTIKEKRWFLSNYKKDTTIKAMVGDKNSKGAFKIIDEKLKDETSNYFDFVRQNIKFWHFKTEETSQGEELYITMNSRGQQLADNETIRARLFQSDVAKEDPIKWSTLWEEWQDFFWKNRSEGATSADKGFNEFLACIGGLQNFKSEKKKFYSKEDFEHYNQVSSKDVLNNLTLPVIEAYINVLKYIEKNKELFKSNFTYNAWVDNSIGEIWGLLNKEYTNWYANSEDANRATERNRMVFIWSLLEFYQQQENEGILKVEDFFKILRIFYLRYHNFDRSVSSIFKDISNYREFGVCKEVGTEEYLKYKLISKIADDEVKEFESIIWEIEDHKFNLDGRDVGSVNIGYLIDLEKTYTLSELKLIKDKLYEVFPAENTKYLIIQNILLYYGEYWYRVSPRYYFNLQFDNWKRIIRDRDQENRHTRNVFKQFFYDFVLFDGTIDDFLQDKRKTILEISDCKNLYEKLCWYNQYLSNKMWSQGNNIALREWEPEDKVFPEEFKFINTKGNFKGGSPTEIFELLPDEIKQNIESNA